MAYTAPRTWVTSELVTSAMLNEQIRDNNLAAFPAGVDAWTSFTPTLTQSGAVTKTVTRAKYAKVGRLVAASYDLAVTGSGTASNRIDIGVPFTAAYANDNIIGAGYVFDSSANLVYAGPATQVTTSAFAIYLGSGAVNNRLGVSGMTAALASGDSITATVTYETAT